MPLSENLMEVGNVVSAVLVMTMFMWVFAMLWQAVFAAQGTDQIAGLTLKHTLWYLLMAELVVLSMPLLAEEISDSVKTGSIAYDLMRPLDFGLFHLSRYAGHVAFRACVNLPAGGAVSISRHRARASPTAMSAAGPMVILRAPPSPLRQ
jgi:ABC-type uncharacterized transport system permease subunit